MNYGGRIDWVGVLVDLVGTRYRNDPSSSTCPLCSQLYAPWIEPFLKNRDPTRWKANDLGDQIRIFRHLRHLPHVNDYPTARKVLRECNAPYHIAVVPTGRGWRDGLKAHIASKGMVVVIPKGIQEPELFVPQQVSKQFEPNVVLSWLKYCKGHKKHCNIKAPEVTGMKLIDCRSNDLIIREHYPDAKYVALSYVWGKPAASEMVTSAPAAKEMPQKEDKTSRLPKDTPLTIRDAIQVTKALGYRFLWVDKYCIDQENATEKQKQCGRMGDIYAGSQLTIFALGHDSNYGLPGVSSRPRFQQLQRATSGRYDFVSTMPDPHLSITQSTWSTRGWTYQEGLFSTRRLFFTDSQAYFECNGMNCVESFKCNLKVLHTQNGQRFRAYHRAGKFVCGNSNQYSHLNVSRSKENHRKVDTIRRFQHQIQQFSKRELTNEDDVLNAFAGIARFYAKTTAKIVSLAGIMIPFPIANLRDSEPERLDHLSYALAWTHRIRSLGESSCEDPSNRSGSARKRLPWTLLDNPKPQRREGFPSWSWAGWFGEVGKRKDLPYCWTSDLSSVRIEFREKDSRENDSEDYMWMKKFPEFKQHLIKRLLTANVLHFDAHVLDPKKLKFWKSDPHMPSKRISSATLELYLSTWTCSLEQLQQKLIDGEFKCVVLGTYGKPRRVIFKAIQAKDKKRSKYRNRRIDLFERGEPDAIICLIVYTRNGKSHRIGLLKVVLDDSVNDRTLRAWVLEGKSRFSLF